MKLMYFLSLITVISLGCEDENSQDDNGTDDGGNEKSMGNGNDGSKDDHEDDSTKDETGGTEDNINANEDTNGVNYAVIQFCNKLDGEAITRLDLSEDPYVAHFAATPHCCTICRKVSSGDAIVLDLYNNNGDEVHQVIPFDSAGEYIVFGVNGEEGAEIVIEELEQGRCETTIPEGMAECETESDRQM